MRLNMMRRSATGVLSMKALDLMARAYTVWRCLRESNKPLSVSNLESSDCNCTKVCWIWADCLAIAISGDCFFLLFFVIKLCFRKIQQVATQNRFSSFLYPDLHRASCCNMFKKKL